MKELSDLLATYGIAGALFAMPRFYRGERRAGIRCDKVFTRPA
jgi:hypothetical protein